MIAIGMKARYSIPELSAFAGFSPSCWAVFVQIEHCADTEKSRQKKKMANTAVNSHFFIGKILANVMDFCYSDYSLFKAGLCNFVKLFTPGIPGK